MRYSPRQYAELIVELTRYARPAAVREIAVSLVELLVRHRTTALIPQIISSFYQVWNESNGVTSIAVVTADRLSPAARKRIVKMFPGTVELEEQVDPSLIGGIRFKIHDTVIDGSIRASLESLRQRLIR